MVAGTITFVPPAVMTVVAETEFRPPGVNVGVMS